MNALIALLIRHGLASLAGFFAAHQINGSSTSGIIVGLIVLVVPTVWSWVSNLLRIDEIKPATFDICKNEVLCTLLGSLVSQGITALSVYFAVDANNPEALLVAIGNATASHFGLHQKALGMPGLKILAFACCLMPLASCSSLVPFMLRHEAVIEEAIVYGARLGAQQGFKRLKTSAKNPVNVQPIKQSVVIPDYGVRVAAALQPRAATK